MRFAQLRNLNFSFLLASGGLLVLGLGVGRATARAARAVRTYVKAGGEAVLHKSGVIY